METNTSPSLVGCGLFRHELFPACDSSVLIDDSETELGEPACEVVRDHVLQTRDRKEEVGLNEHVQTRSAGLLPHLVQAEVGLSALCAFAFLELLRERYWVSYRLEDHTGLIALHAYEVLDEELSVFQWCVEVDEVVVQEAVFFGQVDLIHLSDA